jgi:hypothetical protein
MIDYTLNVALFYSIRIIIVALAFFIGYVIVKNIVEPKIFEPICLTSTDSCTVVDIYLYKNTFVAKERISQVWFWYNGEKLYIYGQASGTCDTNYQPVNIFTISLNKDNSQLNFYEYPNECASTLQTVIDYYQYTLGVSQQTVYLRNNKDNGDINNIFNIINNMVDSKVIYL